MTEIKKESGGVVRIADEVLARIAGTAALEVEGVAGLAGYFQGESTPKAVRKQFAKGINVAVADKTVTLGLAITMRMGAKLHEVASEVQQRVKSAIETMTGLNVAEVNVSVSAVIGIKQRKV
ncbi:MAG: Asp23/Gls24 family envelope stress response protein [Defluviitaleaceae bacterium]|nr:Asp23/Gls24 family envelope stress response protein [Defluviitaleaceae bacterium]